MSEVLNLPCYIDGRPIFSDETIAVHYPYDGQLVGSVPILSERS